MTKWFWEALVSIARIFVDADHPYLGAFVILVLSILPIAGIAAAVLLRVR